MHLLFNRLIMKTFKFTIVPAMVFSLVIISCTRQQPADATTSFTDISVDQAIGMMDGKKNLLVLDVRTPGEVAEGKIEGATVIDFQDTTFTSMIDQLDKGQPILVYCAVGGRSGKTMDLMKEKGFKEVYNLEGGIIAWNAAGKPLVK